jgi:hypothetical protein
MIPYLLSKEVASSNFSTTPIACEIAQLCLYNIWPEPSQEDLLLLEDESCLGNVPTLHRNPKATTPFPSNKMQPDKETQTVKEGAEDQNAVRAWHRPGSKGSIGAASGERQVPLKCPGDLYFAESCLLEAQKREAAMQYDPAAFSTAGSILASTVNTDGQGGESSIVASVQSDGDD